MEHRSDRNVGSSASKQKMRKQSGIAGPPLQGRRVILRPIVGTDHGWLYALSTNQENGFRWRYGGSTPSPDLFVRTLWDQVLVQFVVERRATHEPVGLVVAYAADLHSGHVQIGVLLDPGAQKRGWPLEAAFLFINYLFSNWNIRKLYAECLEFNYRQFASGAGRLFRVEARLRGHHYWNGQHWDKLIASCTRVEWSAIKDRILRFAIGRTVG